MPETGLTADERNAIGHSAAALGGHLRRIVADDHAAGFAPNGAYLSEQLCHYRVACELSGQTPSGAIVDLVERTIAAIEDAA